MIKSEELRMSHSCMSRAREDEMTFVLLARDECAPAVIRYWCELRIKMRKNTTDDPQIVEALRCAEVMEYQRKANH